MNDANIDPEDRNADLRAGNPASPFERLGHGHFEGRFECSDQSLVSRCQGYWAALGIVEKRLEVALHYPAGCDQCVHAKSRLLSGPFEQLEK